MKQSQDSKKPLNFWAKLNESPYFFHFLLYASCYLMVGWSSTFLGPLIPYLAAKESRVQTDYSIIFMAKAIGYILGSLCCRFIIKYFSFHQFTLISISLVVATSFLFSYVYSLAGKTILICLMSIGISSIEIVVLVSTMKCFSGENSSAVFQIIYGCSGAGGLLGPIIVYLFELNTFTFNCILFIVLLPFFKKLQSPDQANNKQQQQNNNQTNQELPMLSLQLMSVAVFLIIGSTLTYGSWISSYAVLNNFATKERATSYSSLFWISITVFRFLMAAVPGSPSRKIIYLNAGSLLTVLLSYVVIFSINAELGLLFFSIIFGLCQSVLFPLLLTIPSEFGFKLTMTDSSTVFIFGSLGEGVVALLVGKTMELYGFNWFLIWLVVISVLCIVIVWINYRLMTNFKPSEKRVSLLAKDNDIFSNSNIEMKDIAKIQSF